MQSVCEEKGQALIVVALAFTCIMGFVGLAVDVGGLLHDKRELQVAADAAAIAGALHMNYPDMVTAAKNASAANGFTDGSNNVTVTVNNPPSSGEYLNQTNYIEVVVRKTEPTVFMSFLHHGSMPVSARAVGLSASSTGNNSGCVYTLGATGTDFSLTGNADVQATNCGINIDSNSSSAMSLTGNVTLDAASIGIVGGYSKTGNIHLTPSSPSTGIIPYSDPLSYLPGYSCTTNSCTPSSGGSTITCQSAVSATGNNPLTLSPGCYKGMSFAGNSTVTLNPGTYIINGSTGLQFSGNNTINGTGVTFYIANGSIGMVGNTTLNLSAPTSGDFNGVLFDQSASDSSAASLTGNASSVIKGVMYFPSASFTLTGNSGSQIYTDFVVSSLSLVGNASFQDYAALGSGVTSPLRVVTLVE